MYTNSRYQDLLVQYLLYLLYLLYESKLDSESIGFLFEFSVPGSSSSYTVTYHFFPTYS